MAQKPGKLNLLDFFIGDAVEKKAHGALVQLLFVIFAPKAVDMANSGATIADLFELAELKILGCLGADAIIGEHILVPDIGDLLLVVSCVLLHSCEIFLDELPHVLSQLLVQLQLMLLNELLQHIYPLLEVSVNGLELLKRFKKAIYYLFFSNVFGLLEFYVGHFLGDVGNGFFGLFGESIDFGKPVSKIGFKMPTHLIIY